MTEVTSTQTKPDTEIGYLLYTVKFLERIITTVLWKYSMSPDLSRASCLCLIRSHQLHTARLLFTSPHVGCNGYQPPNKTALLLTFFTVASRGLASLIAQLLSQ